MHPNSKLLFEKYAKQHFQPNLKVLEIGPDALPSNYQQIVANPAITWDTVDFPRKFPLTYTLDSEYSFPIPTDSYDIVLSGQVLEHVRKIWRWMPEVARVCKPGGLVITINPVSWPYHEAPVDCWRIYPEGMRALYDDAGLEVMTSVWESLELKHFKRGFPGRSPEDQHPTIRRVFSILGTFGFPAERAYDTVTIGRKRL